MDLYIIVMAGLLLFPWSLVVISVAGAIVQRRRKVPRPMTGRDE